MIGGGAVTELVVCLPDTYHAASLGLTAQPSATGMEVEAE